MAYELFFVGLIDPWYIKRYFKASVVSIAKEFIAHNVKKKNKKSVYADINDALQFRILSYVM